MVNKNESILVSVLENQDPDIPNNIVSELKGTFRFVKLSDVELNKDFDDCEVGEPLFCSIKVKRSTYKFLCELIKKETYPEESREILKELNASTDDETNPELVEKEPLSIQRHSRKLQKTLFRPTELKRSKSLDNVRIKDDVLWQLGKTSESLAQNFASFCKIYNENNEKMLKSMETLQKSLNIQTGYQEQFLKNLKELNIGMKVLVGFMTRNINLESDDLERNQNISFGQKDVPRTSKSLNTGANKDKESIAPTDDSSSDSENENETQKEKVVSENVEECVDFGGPDTVDNDSNSMNLDLNVSTMIPSEQPKKQPKFKQNSDYDFNAYLEKLITRHITVEERRNDGFDKLKKDFKKEFAAIQDSFFKKCTAKGESDPKEIWRKSCNALKSRKSKLNSKLSKTD